MSTRDFYVCLWLGVRNVNQAPPQQCILIRGAKISIIQVK